MSIFLHGKNTKINKKQRTLLWNALFFFVRAGLFPFAQLLVTFVSQLSELLGLCKQFLGLFGEGLQQAVVTDLAHDEVLELAPVGFLAVQVEAVLTGLFLGRVETPQVPVTALDGLGLFVLGTTHTDLDAVVDTRSVADDQRGSIGSDQYSSTHYETK